MLGVLAKRFLGPKVLVGIALCSLVGLITLGWLYKSSLTKLGSLAATQASLVEAIKFVGEMREKESKILTAHQQASTILGNHALDLDTKLKIATRKFDEKDCINARIHPDVERLLTLSTGGGSSESGMSIGRTHGTEIDIRLAE